jgi:hypothetical protein
MSPSPAPGWYLDPTNAYKYRFWEGGFWTDQVSNGGTIETDPTPLAPSVAATPPAPGTATTQRRGTTPAPVRVTQPSPRTSLWSVLGILIAIGAIIALIFALLSYTGDDETTPTTVAPVVTEAPATTGGA